jgi:hypothetical protein
MAQLKIPRWKCQDGRELSITEMTPEHIQNCIAMLRRQGYVTPKEWRDSFPPPPTGFNGEEAQAAADAGFDRAMDDWATAKVTGWIPVFERELKRRGYQ